MLFSCSILQKKSFIRYHLDLLNPLIANLIKNPQLGKKPTFYILCYKLCILPLAGARPRDAMEQVTQTEVFYPTGACLAALVPVRLWRKPDFPTRKSLLSRPRRLLAIVSICTIIFARSHSISGSGGGGEVARDVGPSLWAKISSFS